VGFFLFTLNRVNKFAVLMFFRIIQPFEFKFRKPIALLKILLATETSHRHRFGNRRQWYFINQNVCNWKIPNLLNSLNLLNALNITNFSNITNPTNLLNLFTLTNSAQSHPQIHWFLGAFLLSLNYKNQW